MYLAVKQIPVTPPIVAPSADAEIRGFLAGENDGEELLHALYDHILDEPIPERLLAILRR